MKQPVMLKKYDKLLPLICLVAITIIVYLPCLSAYFVNWDDEIGLVDNSSLAEFSKQWSWDAVWHLFKAANGNYIPLVTFTYAIEKFFFAQDIFNSAFIFHLDNLLLHLGATVCVFYLFLRLDVKRTGAFIGALLFGIHPMHVESVAWVTERKDVLYGLFFLLSLLAYVNYVKKDKNKTTWYIIAWLLAVCSCFAKAQAVSIPLCMVILDFYLGRKWYSPKVLILEKLPGWLLSSIFGVANIYVLSSQHILVTGLNMSHYSFIDKLAIGAYTSAIYIVKCIYPYQMLAMYEYPARLPFAAYLSLAIIPALLVLLLWKGRKNRALIFGILFFTFNVMFVLQILPSGNTFLADRYTYIAYIGLFFIAVKGFYIAASFLAPYLRYMVGALVVYLCMFAFMSYQQCKVWRNSVSLWAHCVEVYPDRYFAYSMLGSYYEEVAIRQLPDPYMESGSPINAQTAANYFNIAIAKYRTYKYYSANNEAELLIDRGIAYGSLQKYDSATRDFSKAILLDANRKEGYINRALAYIYEEKYALAIVDYERYFQIDTTNNDAYFRCGICEMRIDSLRKGIGYISKAIAIEPSDPHYYVSRAFCYKKLGIRDSMQMDIESIRQRGMEVPATLSR